MGRRYIDSEAPQDIPSFNMGYRPCQQKLRPNQCGISSAARSAAFAFVDSITKTVCITTNANDTLDTYSVILAGVSFRVHRSGLIMPDRSKFEMHDAPVIGDWYEDDGNGEYMVYTFRDGVGFTWVRVDSRREVDSELDILCKCGLIEPY